MVEVAGAGCYCCWRYCADGGYFFELFDCFEAVEVEPAVVVGLAVLPVAQPVLLRQYRCRKPLEFPVPGVGCAEQISVRR